MGRITIKSDKLRLYYIAICIGSFVALIPYNFNTKIL